MRRLRLPEGASPREMGRVHGQAFAKEIAEIAAIRLELVVAQGRFRDEDQALRVADKHMPLLRAFDEDRSGTIAKAATQWTKIRSTAASEL